MGPPSESFSQLSGRDTIHILLPGCGLFFCGCLTEMANAQKPSHNQVMSGGMATAVLSPNRCPGVCEIVNGHVGLEKGENIGRGAKLFEKFVSIF